MGRFNKLLGHVETRVSAYAYKGHKLTPKELDDLAELRKGLAHISAWLLAVDQAQASPAFEFDKDLLRRSLK